MAKVLQLDMVIPDNGPKVLACEYLLYKCWYTHDILLLSKNVFTRDSSSVILLTIYDNMN